MKKLFKTTFTTITFVMFFLVLISVLSSPSFARDGWCCINGKVYKATDDECKEKGGTFFSTEAEAKKYCDQDDRGWCCLDGQVFPATIEECRKKGGYYFNTYEEAKKVCADKNKLPDLKVEKIALNRKCQVVVAVKNEGPGFVPNSVWTVHIPKSSSVYLHINGKMWGGAAIWKFDPGKSLQSPGGVAVFVSTLVVPLSAKIRATIDHTGQVVEANEMNNELTRVVNCKLRKLKRR